MRLKNLEWRFSCQAVRRRAAGRGWIGRLRLMTAAWAGHDHAVGRTDTQGLHHGRQGRDSPDAHRLLPLALGMHQSAGKGERLVGGGLARPGAEEAPGSAGVLLKAFGQRGSLAKLSRLIWPNTPTGTTPYRFITCADRIGREGVFGQVARLLAKHLS